jgi:hypothetical protein
MSLHVCRRMPMRVEAEGHPEACESLSRLKQRPSGGEERATAERCEKKCQMTDMTRGQLQSKASTSAETLSKGGPEGNGTLNLT